MAKVKGGDAFKKKIDEFAKSIGKAKTLKVGFPEGATYPDGKSLPLIAAINEYGAPSRGQPPRPFFRRMIQKESGGWPAMINALLKSNDYDAAVTLNAAGAVIAGQLQQSINELTDPPLAPSTIERKGFDKPLIHHSFMVKSVTYQVE